MRRFFFCLLLLLAAQPAWAAPSESLESWAKLKVPADCEIVNKVTKVTGWGPPNARLVLWKLRDSASPMKGAVCYLKGDGYTAAPLPPSPFPGWGLFEVEDVFVAHLGKDALLLVRAEHATGMGPTGAQPFSVTWVYRWTPRGPVGMQALTDKIGRKEERKDILRKIGATP